MGNLIKFQLENEEKTLFWFDNWLKGEPIIKKYGSRVIYDTRMSKKTSVCVTQEALKTKKDLTNWYRLVWYGMIQHVICVLCNKKD